MQENQKCVKIQLKKDLFYKNTIKSDKPVGLEVLNLRNTFFQGLSRTEQIFFDFDKTLHMQCTVYFK